MRLKQLVQNSKLIGTKQIVAGKLRQYGALFSALFSCFKTVPNKAPTALLGRFVLFLTNKCIGQIVQSQNITVAHKTPQNYQLIVVKSKLKKNPAFKPEVQQTNLLSVHETCQNSQVGHVLTYNSLRMHFCLYSLLIIPPAFMPTGYIVFVFPFVRSYVRWFVSSVVSYILRQSFG